MSLYAQYIELTRRIKEDTEARKKLEARVLANVKQSKDQKVVFEDNQLIAVDFPQYEYSEIVKKQEDLLRKLKRDERESGKARKISKDVLRVILK